MATYYLTGFAETKAHPYGAAIEVAKFFTEEILLHHGDPELVIIDRRRTIFTGRLMQEVRRLSRTSHRKTTPYHSEANGLMQQINRTIGDMLLM